MVRKPPDEPPGYASEPDTPCVEEDRDAHEHVVCEQRAPRTMPSTSPEVIFRTDFQRLDIAGIEKINILTCADLAYIHHFERAFEAVSVLGDRFLTGMPLHGEVAADLFSYLRNSSQHVPANIRHAATARAFGGDLKEHIAQLDDELMAFYRSCSPGASRDAYDLVPPEGPRAAALWTIEMIQRLLSRNGAGAGHFLAFQIGQQLVKCFRILGSEELSHHLGADFDDGIPGNIERLVPSTGTADAPGLTAFHEARLAVESRLTIRLLAELDVCDPPTDEDLLSLSARLALLRAVSGERREPKAALLDDRAAEQGATIIKMAGRGG